MSARSWAYVFDEDCIIDLVRSNRLKHLARLGPPGTGFIVPKRVADRLKKPPRLKAHQKEVKKLAKWLGAGTPAQFVRDEGWLYLKLLRAGLGDGEAAALSIAHNRRAKLVSRDKLARSHAQQLGVTYISADELLEELNLKLPL